MAYVLGVDAGNTKTIALVARGDGSIIASARGGCGDIYSVFLDLPPEEAARRALATVDATVDAALREAGLTASDLAAGGFSMAGGDWPEDIAYLRAHQAARGLGRHIIVVNDAIGALRAGSPDGLGVAVSCGTGAAIGARAAGGAMWHGGFWTEALGGARLGREALRAVYKAELGIDPPTSLTARVLTFYGCDSVEELLHGLTARLTRRSIDPSQLARVLLDEAAAGDATAVRLAREHGAALGDYALAAARRVGIEGTPFTLVLTGGVMRHPSPLHSSAIVERVRTTSPEARPVASRFEPAIGALLLGLDAAGVTVDSAVMATLEATLPATSVFET